MSGEKVHDSISAVLSAGTLEEFEGLDWDTLDLKPIVNLMPLHDKKYEGMSVLLLACMLAREGKPLILDKILSVWDTLEPKPNVNLMPMHDDNKYKGMSVLFFAYLFLIEKKDELFMKIYHAWNTLDPSPNVNAMSLHDDNEYKGASVLFLACTLAYNRRPVPLGLITSDWDNLKPSPNVNSMPVHSDCGYKGLSVISFACILAKRGQPALLDKITDTWDTLKPEPDLTVGPEHDRDSLLMKIMLLPAPTQQPLMDKALLQLSRRLIETKKFPRMVENSSDDRISRFMETLVSHLSRHELPDDFMRSFMDLIDHPGNPDIVFICVGVAFYLLDQHDFHNEARKILSYLPIESYHRVLNLVIELIDRTRYMFTQEHPSYRLYQEIALKYSVYAYLNFTEKDVARESLELILKSMMSIILNVSGKKALLDSSGVFCPSRTELLAPLEEHLQGLLELTRGVDDINRKVAIFMKRLISLGEFFAKTLTAVEKPQISGDAAGAGTGAASVPALAVPFKSSEVNSAKRTRVVSPLGPVA